MEIQIIIMNKAQVDFDMKPNISNFKRKASYPFYREIEISLD